MPLSHLHPSVARWFTETLGAPSPPQIGGWPAIARGEHTLIAAPTGSGKTLAAFLCALDSLLRQGDALPDETQVLYVSPLKALSNDVQKNLQAPLDAIRALDPSLPEVRVLVRTGDTPAADRARMGRKPPHILVTTPESLYVMLTSEGGRRLLRTVHTAIIDEIHAVAPSRRGAHLALSLERLVALAGEVQRIGLSATQRPIETVARFLGGPRPVTIVDEGHRRAMDLAVELPASPLEAVCSHETWEEIYRQMAVHIQNHTTTLIFTNTRKLAERITARLGDVLGPGQVTSHHGSLSRERRLDAEQRLKAGKLRALVATASLELGIDIGDVDLVLQVGVPTSIATLLQRVGRAGHGLHRLPRGRIYPLTRDDLLASAGIMYAIGGGELDLLTVPTGPVDLLAQQVVAECVTQPWPIDELLRLIRRAWPYRDLDEHGLMAAVGLHTEGRLALLHHDPTTRTLRGTRRARGVALVSGGAIPDQGDFQVVLEPENVTIGSVLEDFALESSAGDVFQLGAQSWRILKVEPGKVRVADAQGVPPTLPFWVGEAPPRSDALVSAMAVVREKGEDPHWLMQRCALDEVGAAQLSSFLQEGHRALGAVPTPTRIVAERFFDETGGQQMILHAPLGSRVNRALGLALRKRICRGFGFELQAAATDEAVLISLGPMHSFPLEEVFQFLHPDSAKELLIQALLAAPMFELRWRWNVTRALVVPRAQYGRRLPPPLVRARAQDALADAFPEVVACGENLPPGDLPVPLDHPLVGQTVADCLSEQMDVEGFLHLLRGLQDGSIQTVAVDLPEPSPFADAILNANPYAFLDGGEIGERRTQFVRRPARNREVGAPLGDLDPVAVAQVREEAWPDPRDAEELHEALGWMGYLTDAEAVDWAPWLDTLLAAGRVQHEGERWYATGASRDPLDLLRGRLDALGPMVSDDPDLLILESKGEVHRVHIDGAPAWCNRRLLSRIQRVATERRRVSIKPVSAADFLRFLSIWQHLDPSARGEGPNGVAEAIAKLSGFEAPAWTWEKQLLPERVRGYRRDWLDGLALSGEVVWARLWGEGNAPLRNTPLCLLPRADLYGWLQLAPAPDLSQLSGTAARVRDLLVKKGASFAMDLQRDARLLPVQIEGALSELVARGVATCDGIQPLRALLTPASERRPGALGHGGRWWLLPREAPDPEFDPVEFVLDRLLLRYGVVFRRLLAREPQPLPWRDLVLALRRRELRGDVLGGYFVQAMSGEQYALPAAVQALRRDRPPPSALEVGAADPLNLAGILTPDPRISAQQKARVPVLQAAGTLSSPS